jgi:glycosyltransferase involved in cell wall biosynthesis
MKKYVISLFPFKITTVPRVIVFLKTYNSARTLQRAIDSVLNQTFKDFRLYIFDNASTDNTREIILENAAKDKRIFALHITTNDIYNDAPIIKSILKESLSDCFCKIDSDDEYEPTYIEEMYNFAITHKLDTVICGYKKINENGNLIKEKALEQSLIVKNAEEYLENFINVRGFLSYSWNKFGRINAIKKRIISKNAFLKKFSQSDDTTFQVENSIGNLPFGIINKSLYKYYQSKDMYTLNLDINPASSYWNSLKNTFTEQEKLLYRLGTPEQKQIDFLYAIFLSFVQEIIERIIITNDVSMDSCKTIKDIFNDDRLIYILEHNDFHNDITSLQNPKIVITEWINKILILFKDSLYYEELKEIEV